jgi:hypothetical protein
MNGTVIKRIVLAAWAQLVVVVATASAILVPTQLVLGMERFAPFQWGAILGTLIFLADLPVQFFAARDQKRGRWLLVLDVLSAVPLWLIPGMEMFTALQLFKLARVARFLHDWRLRHMGQWNVLRLAFFAYWVALSVHWLSTGWVAIRGFDAETGAWRGFLEAWYFCTVTVTTIGYGDITPVTNMEIIYAICMMVFGVAMYSYAIGNVANLISNLHPSRVRYIETMERLTAFMQYRRLPRQLQDRVREYTTYAWEQRLGYDESTFLSGLPSGLMDEITQYLRKDIIQKVPFLKGAPEGLVREIARALKQIVVTPGEFIFRVGDVGREMYFISRGDVEVLGKDGGSVVAILHDGDFFGEMALLLNRPRTATVRAVGYCDLYTIDKPTFDRIAELHAHFTSHIKAMTRERGGFESDDSSEHGEP